MLKNTKNRLFEISFETFKETSLISQSNGGGAVKKPFLMKGNKDIRLMYAKLHKKLHMGLPQQMDP